MNYLRLDLKVCEGCGTLWLRKGVADGVYCCGCARTLADFPAPREVHSGARKPRLARVSRHAAAQERNSSAQDGPSTAEDNGGAR